MEIITLNKQPSEPAVANATPTYTLPQAGAAVHGSLHRLASTIGEVVQNLQT
jgi:hypothetical protein